MSFWKRLLIILLLVFAPVKYVPAAGVVLSDTTENIHLGLAFNYNLSDPGALVGKVDYIWGATKNVPGVYMDGYYPYDRDLNTNSVLKSSTYLTNWQTEHPDWLVYKCDQKNLAKSIFSPLNVPLDITNPAVQDYQLSNFIAYYQTYYSDITYSGIAWDNVTISNNFGRCGIWRNGTWVPLYGGQGARNDQLFKDALLNWARSMYTQIKTQRPNMGVTMNLDYNVDEADFAASLYRYLDIQLHEGGFTNYGKQLVADGRWQGIAQNFEKLNQMNKGFVILNVFRATNSLGEPDDNIITQSQINWAIANYLLVKGSHSYMMIYSTNNDNSKYSYGKFTDRPEYHVRIGHPTSARYLYQNVQRRDYSNGLVLVNPSSVNTYTVTLPAVYTDFYGTRRSTITLAASTGIVLLRGTI